MKTPTLIGKTKMSPTAPAGNHAMKPNLFAILSPLGLSLLLSLMMTAPSSAVAQTHEDAVAAELTGLTGGRVKVIWQQITDLSKYEPVHGGQGGKDGRQIMAFDTQDRKTRVLVPGPARVCGAWILPDGESVVYSDLQKRTVNLIQWDGSGQKELFTDEFCYVLCTLKDPKTGQIWIYVSNHFINAELRPKEFDKAQGGDPTPRGDRVYRVRLDDPKIRELVYDHGQVDLNFRVSGDGRLGGGGFPWPRQGMVPLPLGREQLLGQGCNASIAPDTSYRFFYMQGNHRFICFYDYGDTLPRVINVQVPNNQGMESWLPRWTNRTPYITIGGPIAFAGEERKKSQIWFAKFNSGFTAIEKFVQVTKNPGTWVTSGHAWVEKEDATEDPSTLPPAVRERVNRLLEQPSFGAELQQLAAEAGKEADPARKAELEQARASLTRWAEGSIAKAQGQANENPGRARELLAGLAAKLNGHPLAETARKAAEQIAGAWPVEGEPPAFVWTNPRTNVRMPGQQGIFLRPHDGARYQQFCADLSEGWMHAPKSGPALQAAMKKAKGFTLEAFIQPDRRWQTGLAVILGAAASIADSNFAVMEDDDLLLLQLRTAGNQLGVIPLDKIPGNWGFDGAVTPKTNRWKYRGLPSVPSPFHLALTHDGESLTVYMNGLPVKQIKTGRIDQPFANWGAHDVSFGAAGDGSHRWQGQIEGVAIHARALNAEEIKAASKGYAALRARCPATPRLKVEATLKAKAACPEYKTIAPYFQALSIYHYTIDKTLSGEFKDQDLYVATWTLLDTRPVAAAERAIGSKHVIEIESLNAHPHLESQFLSDLDRPPETQTWLEISAEPAK